MLRVTAACSSARKRAGQEPALTVSGLCCVGGGSASLITVGCGAENEVGRPHFCRRVSSWRLACRCKPSLLRLRERRSAPLPNRGDPLNNPGYYNTWERYWLKTDTDPRSDERRLNGDLKAKVVRARMLEQAMSQPLTSRCGFCDFHSTGPAGDTLAAFKSHRCVPRQVGRSRKQEA